MDSNWLKKYRLDLKISQEELAARLQVMGLSVSRSAISAWETNQYHPPLEDPDSRRILAQVLHVSVPDMLAAAGYEVTEDIQTEAARVAAQIVEHLPPEGQKQALDHLRVLQKHYLQTA